MKIPKKLIYANGVSPIRSSDMEANDHKTIGPMFSAINALIDCVKELSELPRERSKVTVGFDERLKALEDEVQGCGNIGLLGRIMALEQKLGSHEKRLHVREQDGKPPTCGECGRGQLGCIYWRNDPCCPCRNPDGFKPKEPCGNCANSGLQIVACSECLKDGIYKNFKHKESKECCCTNMRSELVAGDIKRVSGGWYLKCMNPIAFCPFCGKRLT